MEVNVVILCESFLIAEGLKCLLDASEQIEVVGIASSIEDLIEKDNRSCDVLVVDVESASAAFASLDKLGTSRVLLINNNVNDHFTYEDLKNKVPEGLSGIMAIDANHILFEKAIMKIHEGELWFDHMTLSKSLMKKTTPQEGVILTKKEVEVLEHVCLGETNKRIAQEMSVSEQTVKSHCNHLFKKFGVRNRVKLVLSASNLVSSYKDKSKTLQ